jgi:uncharacterized repeat protein (TIGR01451 family)
MRNKLYAVLLNHRFALPGLFLAGAMLSGFANAEQSKSIVQAKKQEPLKVALSAKKVQKDAAGKETLTTADKVKPGEIIEYRASYANVSKTALGNVMATLPVPKGLVYVDKTANPAAATATVDGVKFEAVPLKRKVKDKSGKEVIQLVPVVEYKALRWALGNIPAGKAKDVSARMSVAK